VRARSLLAVIALAGAVRAQNQSSQLPKSNSQVRQEFKLVAATASSEDEDTYVASGDVHAQFKGYDIYTDRLVFTKSTQIARMEGNGRLVGASSEILGDIVVVDFKNETFAFEDGKARLSPEMLKGEAKDDVYLTTASGGGTQANFTIKKGLFTTCDKLDPHSKFTVDSARVRPNKYVELRNARLDVLGHTVFGVPYLVIPLIEDGTRYLPDVGQSPDEGYYVKTRFSTPLPGESYFDTRLDYMTKLGSAFGLDYIYERDGLNGKIKAYTVAGADKSSTISATHQQNLGPGKLMFDANYQSHNYLTAPQSTLINTRAQYVLPWTGGNSRLSWYRVGSDRAGFSSVSQSLAFSDSHAWNRNFNTQLDANLARSESSSGTDTERFDLRFNSRMDLRTLTADLLYQRSIPVGGTAGFSSSTDRTPMLTLKSDSRRLFGADFGRQWPIQSEFSVGELADPASGGTLTRMDFNLGINRTDTKGNSSLRWSGGFKQGIYSDDTAQYVLDYNVGWAYAFGRRSRLELGYRNHRAFGFTPLSIDRTGRNDAFSLDLSYQVVPTLLLTTRTGYDVLQADRGNVPWQQLWFQTAWNPSRSLTVKTSSTYDTFNQVWSNMRFDATYNVGDLRVGFGTRYDGRRSVWGSTSLLLQGLKIGRTTFSTALDWNGYTERFEAQHYSIIYDLHEAELVLDFIDNNVGFRSGRQIALFFRLKAFPTRSPFGSGTRGQAIGGGTGIGG
jgi:LPS-assembly protein